MQPRGLIGSPKNCVWKCQLIWWVTASPELQQVGGVRGGTTQQASLPTMGMGIQIHVSEPQACLGSLPVQV